MFVFKTLVWGKSKIKVKKLHGFSLNKGKLCGYQLVLPLIIFLDLIIQRGNIAVFKLIYKIKEFLGISFLKSQRGSPQGTTNSYKFYSRLLKYLIPGVGLRIETLIFKL
jgi:hypothetical protein